MNTGRAFRTYNNSISKARRVDNFSYNWAVGRRVEDKVIPIFYPIFGMRVSVYTFKPRVVLHIDWLNTVEVP